MDPTQTDPTSAAPAMPGVPEAPAAPGELPAAGGASIPASGSMALTTLQMTTQLAQMPSPSLITGITTHSTSTCTRSKLQRSAPLACSDFSLQ